MKLKDRWQEFGERGGAKMGRGYKMLLENLALIDKGSKFLFLLFGFLLE